MSVHRFTRRAVPTVLVIALLAGAPAAAKADSGTVLSPPTFAGGATFMLGAVEESRHDLTYDGLPFSDRQIGPATTEIVIDSDLAAVGPVVGCDLGPADSDFGTGLHVDFSAAEWAAGARVDTAEVSHETGSDELVCSSDGGPLQWSLRWTFDVDRAAPAVVTVTQDPSILSSDIRSDQYANAPGNPTAVSPGQRIDVVGSPATWNGEGGFAYLQSYEIDGLNQYMDDAPSADGSTLSFTVPSTLDPLFPGGSARLTATTQLTENYVDGVFVERYAGWAADVRVVHARAASTTALALRTPATLSFLPTAVALRTPATLSFLPTAVRVSVSSEGSDSLTGTVTVTADAKTVKVVQLRAASKGVVTVWLPPLPRGRHTIVATFSGSADVAPSTSSPIRLLVLF